LNKINLLSSHEGGGGSSVGHNLQAPHVIAQTSSKLGNSSVLLQ